ncbi:MAG: phosphopantetheine-binding protein [Paludibacter sp.]|jgi:acyl carrier protein
MEEKFLEKFREILEISDRELLPGDIFREYEEWNSLVFLSLIAMVDEEFDVLIEGKDFKLLKTNADIINAIKERQ